MASTQLTVTAIAALCLVALTVMTALPGVLPTRWRYDIVAPPDASFASVMDSYGAEGWELVTCRRAMSGFDSDDRSAAYECILKRPR